jgi:Holliday junction DNA helicase RuvA
MIAHLQGKLVEKTPTQVIIDCGGVGYHTYPYIPIHCFQMLILLNCSPPSNKRRCNTLFDLLKVRKRDFKMLLSFRYWSQHSQNNVISLDPKQITNAICR